MTKKKSFFQDKSGLWHFRWKVGGTTVMDAAKVAIDDYPEEPAWFWFNETPAPIYLDDSPEDLVHRWEKWGKACKAGNNNLLELLIVDLARLKVRGHHTTTH